MLSRFHLVPERNGQTYGQTDTQTDRFAISISRVSMLTGDKNRLILMKFGVLQWIVNPMTVMCPKIKIFNIQDGARQPC